jgi:hypothetical protein
MERSLDQRSAPPPPSTEDVEVWLVGLIDGSLTREQVAAWAQQWVYADEPGVEDPRVWDALEALANADAISTDRPYLFNVADFKGWLEELRR